MAGRKQHFIPQVLLRGFDAAKGKNAQVYVFKNGRFCNCTNLAKRSARLKKAAPATP